MMFALTPEVQIAAIGGAAVVISATVAVIPALISRKSTKSLADAVGEQNGHGSLMSMVGHILSTLDDLKDKVDGHDSRILDLEGQEVEEAPTNVG